MAGSSMNGNVHTSGVTGRIASGHLVESEVWMFAVVGRCK